MTKIILDVSRQSMNITGGHSDLPPPQHFNIPVEQITPADELWNHVYALKEELEAMAAYNMRVTCE